MSRRSLAHAAALLVPLLLAVGCGNSDRLGEGTVTVQSVASANAQLCGQTGNSGQTGTFNILGSGFLSEHGVDVTVVMTAVAGTPFEGGTEASVELPGQVITDTLIVSQLPNYTGTTVVTLTVILPGGNDGVSLPGTITIGGFLDGPYAFSDFYDTDIDTPLSVTAAMGPLVNDFGRQCLGDGQEPGPQNSPPSVTGFTIAGFDAVSAGGGTITMGPDGAFTYTPAAGYEGVDSFGYTMDDQGFTASATVFVGVDTGGLTKPRTR